MDWKVVSCLKQPFCESARVDSGKYSGADDMNKTPIQPLRKISLKGEVYARLANIEAKLVDIVALPRDEIAVRCLVHDDNDPDYIPSECLMYLIRENRTDQQGKYFETVYKALTERVLTALPLAENTDLTEGNIRYETFGRFTELLAKDRMDYLEKLDFFEIRFQSALATLRADVERKAYTDKKRSAILEFDHDTGRFSEEVERAARDFNPFESEENDDSDYRLRLDKAIDSLPAMQKAIVEMMRKGIPIDSIDPEAVTIAKTLGKVEKTIRTHRDKAFQALRAALTEGVKP